MTPITHALLPAILSSPLLPRTGLRDYYRAAGVIAIAGIVPDIVDPHVSLAARYSSWSHTILACVGFAVLMFVLALVFPRRLSLRLAFLAGFAYSLHVLVDGLSGGVPAWLPFSDEIFRVRLIRWHYWLQFDAAFVFLGCVVFWWLPWWKWDGRRRPAPLENQ